MSARRMKLDRSPHYEVKPSNYDRQLLFKGVETVFICSNCLTEVAMGVDQIGTPCPRCGKPMTVSRDAAPERAAVAELAAEYKRLTLVNSWADAFLGKRVRHEPPAFAEVLLSLVTKKELREAVLGDCGERAARNAAKFGRKRAIRLYWAEVIRSVAPLAWAAIKRLGIATLLVDAIRRFLGERPERPPPVKELSETNDRHQRSGTDECGDRKPHEHVREEAHERHPVEDGAPRTTLAFVLKRAPSSQVIVYDRRR